MTDPNDYYLWTADGEMYGGTLADYAHCCEVDHYAGLGVSEPRKAIVGQNGEPTLVSVELARHYGNGDDGYRCVIIRDGGNEAQYRIDLRA